MTDDFYGTGLTVPLQLGVAGLRTSTGVQKVEESLKVILRTNYGERVMRPLFGCNLTRLVFAPNNETTANLARHYVQDGLARWEPRVEVLDVAVSNDPASSALRIQVTYRLRATLDVYTLVDRFPLEPPA